MEARTSPEILMEVAAFFQQKTGLPLWERSKSLPRTVTLEGLLVRLAEACNEVGPIVGTRGDRERTDIACAAADAATLWSELSGKRFSKNLSTSKKIQNAEYPWELEFDSAGPQFVRETIRALDPSVTFAEVRTALAKLPVNLPVQKKASRKGGTLD